MKTKLYLFAAIIMALINSSCGNDNNGHLVMSQGIPNCFSNVIEDATGESTIDGSISSTLTIDYTDNLADVVINGLKLPNGSSISMIKLAGLKINMKDGWFICEAASVTADTGTSQSPTLSNFKFKLLDRNINLGSSSYEPALEISFNINSTYTVYITRTVQYLAGTTHCEGMGLTFDTQETFYGFGIDPQKEVMELVIYNAQFMDKMPKMNFSLRKIDFSMEGNTVVSSAKDLTPYIGDTPNDNYPISNLSGTLNPSTGFTLSFECAPGSMAGMSFKVNAQGSFTDVPVSQE